MENGDIIIKLKFNNESLNKEMRRAQETPHHHRFGSVRYLYRTTFVVV